METPKLAKPTGTVLGLLLIIAFQTTSDEHRVLPKLSSLSLHPSRISNLEDEHQGILHRRDSSVELPKSSSSISDDEDNSDLLAGGTTALRGQRQGSLTYLNGLSLVVGLQIGSGIFSAPSEVSKHVPNAPAAIAVWLVAGLLVWTGALAFIELGRAIPKNGGIQEYIRQCYGDIYAFLFSWVWIAIVKPCSIAVISTIFAEHLNSAVLPNSWTSVWVNKLVALIGITLITMVNCLGTNTGANAANGFLVLKLFGLFSIVAIGIFIGVSGKALSETQPTKPVTPETAFNTTPNAKLPGLWVTLGEYVTAFFGALFCYGGWETVGFVAGDMRDPQRDLSRVINSAMAIVLFGFVFMNLSLYIVLPMDTIRDQKTVAVTFGYYVFGTPGTLIYSFVVSMSCLGALNSNVFATGRLCAAASKRNYLPRFFGEPCYSSREEERVQYQRSLQRFPIAMTFPLLWTARRSECLRWDKKVPVYAMVLNGTIASFYVVIGTFGSLLTFIGISEYLFFFFAVLGVFILRRQSPLKQSANRTWSLNPVVFCSISGFLVTRGILTDPIQGLGLLTIAVSGLLIRSISTKGGGAATEDINLAFQHQEA